MNKKLQHAYDELERQREQLLSQLRGLSNEKLTWSPGGKWSTIRILSHLITGERTGLEYVRKKMLGVEGVGNAGLYEEFKMLGLALSQRLSFIKYKAPRVIEERTIVYKDLDEVEKAWSSIRLEWKVFLENIPEHHVNRKIFRHVVAGRLNVEQGMRFFREHVIHHMPQIRALVKY